jgi:hypothetical protein
MLGTNVTTKWGLSVLLDGVSGGDIWDDYRSGNENAMLSPTTFISR